MRTRNYLKVKRFFDCSISLICIIILLPLFIIISIAIKLDSSGPVIFKQQRLTKNGKKFIIYKFRSMVVNSDIYDLDTKKNDNRITNIGKFIRFFSIDELPQLFNVIKGDMSLVGPRPLSHPDYEDFSPIQQKRFLVKPGITGLAQINGRKSLDLDTVCQYDIQYVDSMSFLLDLKILFLTFILFTKNNY